MKAPTTLRPQNSENKMDRENNKFKKSRIQKENVANNQKELKFGEHKIRKEGLENFTLTGQIIDQRKTE